MDYTQLDIEHKRAFLMNLRCLGICTLVLAETAEESIEELNEAILAESLKTIEQLTDEAVEEYIKKIEHQHREHGGVFQLKR